MQNEKISQATIRHYRELCNFTGNIVGEYDEDSGCSYEKYQELQEHWWDEEIKIMPLHEQQAANLGYVIFEAFYDFISYWEEEKEKVTQEDIQFYCVKQMQANIFSILWNYEESMENEMLVTPRMIVEIGGIKSDILFVMENRNDMEFQNKIEAYTHLNILDVLW